MESLRKKRRAVNCRRDNQDGTNIEILACKARTVYEILKGNYPLVKTHLHYKNEFEFVISVILSAQTRDERVNEVTKILFKKYPTALDLAKAEPGDIARIISSIGLYRVKARYIIETAKLLTEKFSGNVPRSQKELIELPGLGRKGVNVVLYVLFSKESIFVDTHVRRLSLRIGFTKQRDPLKIEEDLIRIWEKVWWGQMSSYLILHGRTICRARSPLCSSCVIKDYCDYYLS